MPVFTIDEVEKKWGLEKPMEVAPSRPLADPNDIFLPEPKPVEQQAKEIISIADTNQISLSEAEQIHKTVDKVKQISPKGKIGFWEAAFQDLEKKVPFSPMGALEQLDVLLSAKRLRNDDYDSPPVFSSLVTAEQISKARAAGAWAIPVPGLPKEWTPELQREADRNVIENYLEKMAERQAKGYTGWGKAGQIASMMPAWMVEFALTGGLGTIKNKTAKEYLTSQVKHRIAKGLGTLAIGTAKRVTIGMPHRVSEAILTRLNQDPENWATAITLGWGEVYIEALTESVGELASPAGRAIVQKLPFGRKLLAGMESLWVGSAGGRTGLEFVRKIGTKAGFNGIITEIGEERLATLLHGLVGTEDFGAGEDAGPLARIIAGFKQDWENKWIEAGVFSAIGGAQVIGGRAVGLLAAREGEALRPEQQELQDVVSRFEQARETGDRSQIIKAAKEIAELPEVLSEEEAAVFEREAAAIAPEAAKPAEAITPAEAAEAKPVEPKEPLSKLVADIKVAWNEFVETRPLIGREHKSRREAAEKAIKEARRALAKEALPKGTPFWQMTKRQFEARAILDRNVIANLEAMRAVLAEDIGIEHIPFVPAEEATTHKSAIRKALIEGKTVPPEVLAEYPELVAEAKPAEAPPEKPPTAKELKALPSTPEIESIKNIPAEEPPGPPLAKLPEKPVARKGEAKERKFITSVKEEFPELETRVAGQYVPRSTDRLSVKARNLVLDDSEKAERFARGETNDDAIATTCELIKHYTDQAQKAESEGVKNTLLDKAADIANTQAKKLTELGRAVQAASILGRLTPEGQLRFAQKVINDHNEKLPARAKKIPNLTTEQTQEILSRAKEIQDMPDGPEKAQKFWELQNYIADLRPTPLYKKLINLWKAGLLTAIKTSGVNTFSNVSHGVTESIKDIPGVAVDKVTSVFTKERTLALTGRGLTGGIKEGFQKGWRYLKTGYDERNVRAKLDYRRVTYGKSKFSRWLQAYEETVFDMMGAEDQPFYYGAKARSLQSQAIAQAINKKLKANEAKSFIDNLVENPTDEMLKYATIDAETAVFQNRTMAGDIARQIQRAPGGEVVLPFGRTPAAVATQIINYSPIGIPKTIIENIGKGRFDQRLFSQGIGRGMTGTAVMVIGVELFKAGLMTLDRPKTERERELWQLEGRNANSIKIGDKWRQVRVLGPAGFTLLVGGHFQSGLNETGSPTKAIVKAYYGLAKSFSEESFVRGVKSVIDAIEEPGRAYEVWFSSLAGSTVPTIVADTARALDSTERRTEGPIQRIQGRIPVLREKLEPRKDVFGQDVVRYGGNVLEVMADPTRPSKIKQDRVVDELRRLWDKGVKVSPTLLGDKFGYKALIQEENTELWQRAGKLTYQAIFNAIHSGAYYQRDNAGKGRLIEYGSVEDGVLGVDDAKLIARAEMARKILRKSPKRRKELVESGFLTKQVEAKMESLF